MILCHFDTKTTFPSIWCYTGSRVIVLQSIILPPRPRSEAIYRTLYIEKSLAQQIGQIAIQNNTSWNHAAIALIQSGLSCLNKP